MSTISLTFSRPEPDQILPIQAGTLGDITFEWNEAGLLTARSTNPNRSRILLTDILDNLTLALGGKLSICSRVTTDEPRLH